MATVQIHLAEDTTRLAIARAAAAGHSTLDEYFHALILADAEAAISPEMKSRLVAAFETSSRELAAADWDEKRRMRSAGLESDWR